MPSLVRLTATRQHVIAQSSLIIFLLLMFIIYEHTNLWIIFSLEFVGNVGPPLNTSPSKPPFSSSPLPLVDPFFALAAVSHNFFVLN
jgi:hypothetical protein